MIYLVIPGVVIFLCAFMFGVGVIDMYINGLTDAEKENVEAWSRCNKNYKTFESSE